jgi:mevalonate kinase
MAERDTTSLAACGKVILFGEHAVVYGRPALALGLKAVLRPEKISPRPKGIQLRVDPWGLSASTAGQDVLSRVLDRLDGLMEPSRGRGMSLYLRADIPPRCGLGSSAALAVVLVRALARVRRRELTASQVRELAHELEKIFHGTPSGLDDMVATYGGLIYGHPGNGCAPPQGAAALGGGWYRLSGRVPGLVVAVAGPRASTAEMVMRVAEFRKRRPREAEAIFDAISACLQRGLVALAGEDYSALGEELSKNHRLLQQLGLSCEKQDELVRLALQAGAYGAKITGAGGGGAVIALAPGREQQVLAVWKAAGYRCWPAM